MNSDERAAVVRNICVVGPCPTELPPDRKICYYHAGAVTEPMIFEQRCSRCKESWPLDEQFYRRDPRNRSGFFGYCIACEKERQYDTYHARRNSSAAPA